MFNLLGNRKLNLYQEKILKFNEEIQRVFLFNKTVTFIYRYFLKLSKIQYITNSKH